MPVTITLTGFKDFEAKCRALPDELFEEIGGEVEDAGRLWATGAKRDAPKDVGFLANGISSRMIGEMETEVTSNADYSAYVEWGTKKNVRVPSELQSYANQFRGQTAPGGARAIYEWCRRVGIPQNAWVFVYLSIMRNGIRPHPFFFIQVPIVQEQLNKNVQTILNTEH